MSNDSVLAEDLVAWLNEQAEGTVIVQGREARAPNEVEYNDAIRQASQAVRKLPARTLRIYGHSDDLVEMEGTDRQSGEPDEITAGERGEAAVRITAKDSAGETQGLTVVAEYDYKGLGVGCWLIGIVQLGEAAALPGWPMRWSNEEYTPVLELDVPEGTRVVQVLPKEEDQ